MERKITGILIYYYKVCKRKLWYFSKNIQMESGSEHIALGKVIDESTYKNQDKHININDEISIDFIKEHKILHEVKKSKKVEQASILQIKYYLYYLNKRGVAVEKGKLDYPLLRETVDVFLNDEDILEIENIIKEINNICDNPLPPKCVKKGICKECAYYDLCFI